MRAIQRSEGKGLLGPERQWGAVADWMQEWSPSIPSTLHVPFLYQQVESTSPLPLNLVWQRVQWKWCFETSKEDHNKLFSILWGLLECSKSSQSLSKKFNYYEPPLCKDTQTSYIVKPCGEREWCRSAPSYSSHSSQRTGNVSKKDILDIPASADAVRRKIKTTVIWPQFSHLIPLQPFVLP